MVESFFNWLGGVAFGYAFCFPGGPDCYRCYHAGGYVYYVVAA
ncbi:hypothetical protein DJICPGNB_01335 [Escherichia coli]|nr:hypothetical protein DJICPGNB_01335 [Escherichia coli]